MKPHTRPLISFIVPVWRDEGLLAPLIQASGSPHPDVEWIVAAVTPGDALHHLAEAGTIRLVESPAPSRGAQLNAGARIARGSLLCFHHADTEMSPAHLASLLAVARDHTVIGGAFHRRFDNRHPGMQQWEHIVQAVNSHLGPVFGDQSIYVKTRVFQELKGFAEIPIMEDLEFSRRLRRLGHLLLLRPAISSSPRRFHRIGNWNATLINISLILLFYAGVSPARLHRWYYGSFPPSPHTKDF